MRTPRSPRRSFRPAVEACEARALLNAAGAGRMAPAVVAAETVAATAAAARRTAIEPLDFGVTVTQGKLVGTTLRGKMQLRPDGDGGLVGTLDEATRGALRVSGRVVDGDRLVLQVRLAPGSFLRLVGPVLRGRTDSGQWTLYSRGSARDAKGMDVGVFSLTGSDTTLPVPRANASAPAVRPGTRLAPTGFIATITAGPDAGTRLSGLLDLGVVGRGGRFSGKLHDAVLGDVPVTGRVVGDQVRLRFDLGAKGTVDGVGPLMRSPGRPGDPVSIRAIGTLSGLRPGNEGDWVVGQTIEIWNLRSFPPDSHTPRPIYAPGAYIVSPVEGAYNQGPAVGDRIVLTADGSYLPNATIQANLSSYVSMVTYGPAYLMRRSVLTGATFVSSRIGAAWFDNSDMRGARFIDSVAFATSFRNADLRGAVFQNTHIGGADFTGADLRGAVLRNLRNEGRSYLPWNPPLVGYDVAGIIGFIGNYTTFNQWNLTIYTGPVGHPYVGIRFNGANLSGADLSGSVFFGINGTNEFPWGGADFENANLSNANLSNTVFARGEGQSDTPTSFVGANLSGANFRGAKFLDNSIRFDGADLRGADFRGAVLPGSIWLQAAHTEGANFTGATIYEFTS